MTQTAVPSLEEGQRGLEGGAARSGAPPLPEPPGIFRSRSAFPLQAEPQKTGSGAAEYVKPHSAESTLPRERGLILPVLLIVHFLGRILSSFDFCFQASCVFGGECGRGTYFRQKFFS